MSYRCAPLGKVLPIRRQSSDTLHLVRAYAQASLARAFDASAPIDFLPRARVGVEGILQTIYVAESGDSNVRKNLGELMSKPEVMKAVPHRLQAAIRYLQEVGNYASHSQPITGSHRAIDEDYVAAAVSSLRVVTTWFFEDWLHEAVPPDITAAPRFQREANSGTPSPSATAPRATQVPPVGLPPRRWWTAARAMMALGATTVVVAGIAIAVWRLHGLASEDWLFADDGSGKGWLGRCAEHVHAGKLAAARGACDRATAAPDDVAADAYGYLALVAQGEHDRSAALAALVTSLRTHRTSVGEDALAKICGTSGSDASSGGDLGWKVVDASPAQPAPLVTGPDEAHPTLLQEPECVRVGTPSVSEKGVVLFHVGRIAGSSGDPSGYLGATALLPMDATADDLAKCREMISRGVTGPAEAACRRAASTGAPDALVAAAGALASLEAQGQRLSAALDWRISAYKLRQYDDFARDIATLCARADTARLTPGGARHYAVVSWQWQDRHGNVRAQPSTEKDTATRLAVLPRTTCVLVAGAPKLSEDGSGLHWFPVEVAAGGKKLTGWMNEILIDPD